MQCVSIDHEDLVADIGAGTGEIAHQIWKSSQLKNPVVCVEPSSSMLEILKEKDGVDPVQACIEDFFSLKKYNKLFNKFLISGSVHHFPDLVAAFTSLFEHLTDNGSCVVVAATNLAVLFEAARDMFCKTQVRNRNYLYGVFKHLELKWKETKCTYHYTIPKTECYAALRDRYITHLEQFTDQEIEEGILELDREYPNQEVMELNIELIVCVVTKA